MSDVCSEQLEQFAHMVNYPFWHQIQASNTNEERHWWQTLCHQVFQRNHQTSQREEEEQEDE